jgi:hypothetical protein
MSGHVTRCTLNGRTYDIPDMWLVGICQSNDWDIPQAVGYWAWQVELEERVR